MDAIVLVAGLIVLAACVRFWSRPDLDNPSWRALAFLTVPVFVMAAGTLAVTGLAIHVPVMYAAAATAMLVLPPMAVRFLKHLRRDIPRWIGPVAWLLAAGALAAFIIEETVQAVFPGVWFSIAAVSPYIAAAVAMLKIDPRQRGTTAMRQRYAAVAIAGAAIITLAASMEYHGILPSASPAINQWGHLLLAGGFVFGITPPQGFVTMWRNAALQRVRVELPALVDGVSEQEYIDRAVMNMQPLVLPGVLTMHAGAQPAAARTVDTQDGRERWDVPVLGDEYVMRIEFSTIRVFPKEDEDLFHDMEDLLSTRLRAFRYLQSQRDILKASQETDRVKSEFLRSLGHELSNPLSPIRLQLAILQKRLGEDRSLEVIERNAQRLMRIIGNIRDVAKLQDGRVPMNFEDLDLAGLVENVVASMRPVAEEAGLELKVDVQEAHCEVDRGRMEQVVGNLLSNAIKYTPEGRVVVAVASEEDHVRMTVRDTGRGLTADQLREIGTAYRRFHADEVAEGTGIGINVCRAIVQAHNGTMDIESEGPGEGVTVTVRLPLRQP